MDDILHKNGKRTNFRSIVFFCMLFVVVFFWLWHYFWQLSIFTPQILINKKKKKKKKKKKLISVTYLDIVL